MGSVLSGVGNAVGSIFGSVGGGVAQGAGATNQYQIQNPYAQQQLQEELNQQSQIYGQQQTLAQALQQQMAGGGPNPAQTQFLGNQNSNIANAQGLIASQRGLNPALAARMGANAAAQGNQQAAMGSALLQQQQQLGATANLGNLYGQMQQGNLAQQGLYNQASSGSQQGNANIAGQNAQVRGQLAGGLLQAGGGVGSALAGASHGGKIMGDASVEGDSPKNDTVHTMLSPGEIVVPRSMAHDPEKAKEFIDHLLKNEKKSDGDYGEVLKARRKRKAS